MTDDNHTNDGDTPFSWNAVTDQVMQLPGVTGLKVLTQENITGESYEGYPPSTRRVMIRLRNRPRQDQ
ncbi:MAG: hypothetical protein C0462_05555 [Alcanivorax sp.]|nr:hypothetical protein [Alcanivorax sp.]